MIVQKQTKNWDFEVLNPIETKKVVGGDWWRYIDEVVIPWDGTDWGDWWDGSGLYDPSNPYGNGGNDSGSGGNNNPDQNGFPDHICKQGPNANTCAANALSYAAGYFGASGITASDFAEMVGKDYYNMAFNNGAGLTAGEIGNIVDNVFNNNVIGFQLSDLIYATGSGNPVIGLIANPSGNDGHAVVIVGADANGTVCFMDSMTGNMNSANLNTINFVGNFVQLTGVKDNALVNQAKNDTNDISACSICGR